MLGRFAARHLIQFNQDWERTFTSSVPWTETKKALTVRWCTPLLYSSTVLSWCVLLHKHTPIWACSRFCVQYGLFTAFHYYLDVLYISKPCVSVKQSPHSNFILITNHTHSALYLKGTAGLKTQSFIKTAVMAFCQRWPQHRRPFGLIQCSLSPLEASPWKSYGHFLGHQRVQQKWPDCKNGLCAAICFAINNGWVTTSFKIIKLLDGSKMKTCIYTETVELMNSSPSQNEASQTEGVRRY